MDTHVQPVCVRGMDFRDLRLGNYYYVDKTAALRDLLCGGDNHVLLTRPRRFGKTLMLSTLHRFLELDYACPGRVTEQRRRLFDGLEIAADEHCCREYLAQHPVVILSLKNIEGNDFAEALGMLRQLISRIFIGFRTLFSGASGTLIDAHEQRMLERYYDMFAIREAGALKELLSDALYLLCSLLHRIFSRPVYVLIDEYDTPLNEAHARGYGEEMTGLIRRMLHPLLKDDARPGPSPEGVSSGAVRRCILTGCLRVGKASIFTGANNVTVLGMEDQRCRTLLGFTDAEVQAMLEHYGLGGRAAAVRDWYDGYRFGRDAATAIYCPWSIASFCDEARHDAGAVPRNYWADSSSNSIVTMLMDELPDAGLRQLRALLDGAAIDIRLQEAMSYADLRGGGCDAFFSMLYLSGYLTRTAAAASAAQSDHIRVTIPNQEVRACFRSKMADYLQFDDARLCVSAAAGCTHFIEALERGDAAAAAVSLQELLTSHLPLTLTHAGRDGGAPEREWIYAMFVHFVLSTAAPGRVRTLAMERPLGDGRADESFVFGQVAATGCILEIKLAAGTGAEALADAARRGLRQIAERRYAAGLLADPELGVSRVLGFGIGCVQRRCAMLCGELS